MMGPHDVCHSTKHCHATAVNVCCIVVGCGVEWGHGGGGGERGSIPLYTFDFVPI